MATLQAFLVFCLCFVLTDCRMIHQAFNPDDHILATQIDYRHMYPQIQRGLDAYGLGSKIRQVQQRLADMNHNFAHNAQGSSVHDLLSQLHLQNLKDIYEADEQFIMNGGLNKLKNLLFQSQNIMNQNALKNKQKKNEKPYGYPLDAGVQNFGTGNGNGNSETELKEPIGTDANVIDNGNGNGQRDASDITEQNQKRESYGNSKRNEKPEESSNDNSVNGATQSNTNENDDDNKSDEADDKTGEGSKSDDDDNGDDDKSGEDNNNGDGDSDDNDSSGDDDESDDDSDNDSSGDDDESNDDSDNDSSGDDDESDDDSDDNDSSGDDDKSDDDSNNDSTNSEEGTSNESNEGEKGDQNANIIFSTMEDRFLGKDFSLDIDCMQLPCMNGGECSQNIDGIAECKCPNGHTGRFCEKCADPCDKHSCSNGGTCVSNNGIPWCLCTDGSHGENCETIAFSSIDNTDFLAGQSELDKVQRNLNQLAFLLSKAETESSSAIVPGSQLGQPSETTSETFDALGLDSLKEYEGINAELSKQSNGIDKDGLLSEQQQKEIANWLYQQISKTSTMSSSGQSNNDRVATNLQSTKASRESDDDESDESGEDNNATPPNKEAFEDASSENVNDNLKKVYKDLLGNNDIVDLSQFATDEEQPNTPDQNDLISSESDNDTDLSSEESSQDDSSDDTDTTDENSTDNADKNSSENDSSSEGQSNGSLKTDDNNSFENPNDERSSDGNQSDGSTEESYELKSSSGESSGNDKSDESGQETETSSVLTSSDVNPDMIPSLEDLLFGNKQIEKLGTGDIKMDGDKLVDADFNPHVGHTLNNAILPGVSDKTSISDKLMNTNSKITNVYQKWEKGSQISQTVRSNSDVKTPYGKKKSSAIKSEVNPTRPENMLSMPEDNALNKPYAPSTLEKGIPKIAFTTPIVNNPNAQPEVDSLGNVRNLGLSSETNTYQHQVNGQRIMSEYGKQNALQHPASFSSDVTTHVFGDKGNHITQSNYPDLPQIIQTGVNPTGDGYNLFNQQFPAAGDTIPNILYRASVGSNVVPSKTIFHKAEKLADGNSYHQVDTLNGFQHLLSGGIDHSGSASDKMMPAMYFLQKYASGQPVSPGFGSTSKHYGKLNRGKDNAFSSFGDNYGSTTVHIRPPIFLPTEHYNYEDIKHLLQEDHLSKLSHHIDFLNQL